MKNSLLIIIFLLVYFTANSQTFEYKGIEYEVTSEEDKEVATVTLNDKSTIKIKIPNTVKYNNSSYKVTAIGESSFRNCYDLEKVKLPNKLSLIDSHAFENYESLKRIEIPNFVT